MEKGAVLGIAGFPFFSVILAAYITFIPFTFS
jgi:hypothetical protein